LILEHPNAPVGESLYLERALGIGSDPVHTVSRRSSTRLDPSHLQGRDVVVVNDAPLPRGTAGRLLREFVLGGGGLLVTLGQRSTANSWPTEFTDLLRGTVGTVVDRLDDRGTTLSVTDFDHPLLELFRTPRSGDFSRARFFRYRRLNQTGDSEWDVLARFDDGEIALAEARVGEGRVVVLTSGLTNSWNDFPVQPVFLPFLHQLTKHLAGYAPGRTWFAAGEVVDLDVFPDMESSGVRSGVVASSGDYRELVVESPSGTRSVRNTGEDSRYLTLEEQGVYRVRLLDDEAGPSEIVAVNVSSAESDLATIDPEELASAVTVSGSSSGSTSFSATLTPEERERRQGLWWYLLVAALLVLVAETVLSNRIQHAAR